MGGRIVVVPWKIHFFHYANVHDRLNFQSKKLRFYIYEFVLSDIRNGSKRTQFWPLFPDGDRLINSGHYAFSNSFFKYWSDSERREFGVWIFDSTTRAKVRILVFSAENIICTYRDILASITGVLLVLNRKHIEKNYVPKMSTFDKITVRAENTQYDYSKENCIVSRSFTNT